MLESFGLGLGICEFCKNSNQSVRSTKGVEFHDCLIDCWLFM